jgi:DNA-binding PadR family transcriptional regulator
MSEARDVQDSLPLTHVSYHVLLAIADKPLHGYGIIKEVTERTDGRIELEAGTLYAAIKRLSDDQLLDEASPPRSGNTDSRRKYYRLTPFGRRVLRAESQRLVSLIDLAREKRILPEAPPTV